MPRQTKSQKERQRRREFEHYALYGPERTKRKQICFSVSVEIMEELNQIAKEDGVSRASVIRDALKVCLRPKECMGLEPKKTYF